MAERKGRTIRRRAQIGSSIEIARTEAGLSRETCARRVGVSYHTWWRWEQGRGSVPAELLPEVAKLLATSVEALISGATKGRGVMRYAYLGDRHTRDDLRGRRCDPVKNERGVCVVGGSKQLVQFDDGEVAVVLRRRLRRI